MEITKEEKRQLFEDHHKLIEKRNDYKSNFIKFLVGLGSGSLTLLNSFQDGQMVCYKFQLYNWLLLSDSIGILFGLLYLVGDARMYTLVAQDNHEYIQSIQDGKIVNKKDRVKPFFFSLCYYICLLSVLGYLIFLALYRVV